MNLGSDINRYRKLNLIWDSNLKRARFIIPIRPLSYFALFFAAERFLYGLEAFTVLADHTVSLNRFEVGFGRVTFVLSKTELRIVFIQFFHLSVSYTHLTLPTTTSV